MGPVFVKRAIFVGQYSYSEWLIADYSARVVIIFFSVYALRSGLVRSDHKAAGLIRSAPIFVIALSAMAMTQILRLGAPFDVVLWKPLIDPVLDIDQRLAVFDLILGLVLVALSEELAFRKYLFGFLEQLEAGPLGVVLLSSTLFALLHFTSGSPTAISAFIYGCILGILFLLTRRLSLCVIAHYLIDFYIFGSWYGGAGLFSRVPV